MSMFRTDALTLVNNLGRLQSQRLRENDRIHNVYRAEISRNIYQYLMRGNLSHLANEQELFDFIHFTRNRARELERRAPHLTSFIQSILRRIVQNRKDMLSIEIEIQMTEMHLALEENISTCLIEGYESSYYHSNYNIARRMGNAINVPRLNEHSIRTRVNVNWSGQIWEERQWNNNLTIMRHMLVILENITEQPFDMRSVVNLVMRYFEYSRWQTVRILRSEFGHFNNQAIDEAHDINSLRLYEYIATLDCVTCGDCGDLDGRIFRLEDKDIGRNAPLLHPHCRCTTAPTFPEEEESRWRLARQRDRTNTVIDGNITYSEWYKQFVR